MYTAKTTYELGCDMEAGCSAAVTHIDEKGFVYCAPHGIARRRGGVRCRKLTARESQILQSGKPLPSYGAKPRFSVGDKVFCTVWAARGWHTVTDVRPRDGYIKITNVNSWCPPHNFVAEGADYTAWLSVPGGRL